MANTNADAITGGSVAGGILNLSDADLIALVISGGPMATDTSPLLTNNGTIPSGDEHWGVIVG